MFEPSIGLCEANIILELIATSTNKSIMCAAANIRISNCQYMLDGDNITLEYNDVTNGARFRNNNT